MENIKIQIMNTVSVPPKIEGRTGYWSNLRLTDEEIDRIVDLLSQ
jgi:hypothetical protein